MVIIVLILLFLSDCQFSCDSMEDTLEYDEKSLKTILQQKDLIACMDQGSA